MNPGTTLLAGVGADADTVAAGFTARLLDWTMNAATWTEDGGLLDLLVEHVWLSAVATGLAILLALAPAVWLAHNRRGQVVATVVANAGRALPSFGVIVLVAVLFIQQGRSATFWPLVIALVALAVPPIFTNAYTGVRSVDAEVLEASRGQGGTEREVLLGVELPLALPLALDGIRLAAVQVVATTALGAVVAPTGGLGRPILRGFALLRQGGDVELVGAAVLVALLTVLTDRGIALAGRVLVPTGVRRLQG